MAKAAPKSKKAPARRVESAAAKKTVTKSAAPTKPAAARPAKAANASRAAAAKGDGSAKKVVAKKVVAKAAPKTPAVKSPRDTSARTPAKKSSSKPDAAPKAPAPKTPAKAATPKVTAKTTKAAPAKAAPVAKADAAKAPPNRPERAAPDAAKSAEAAKSEAAKAEVKKAPPRKTTVICPLSGFEVKPDKPNLSPRTVDRLRTKLLDERAHHISQAEQLQAEAAQLALDREEGDTQFDEEGGEGDTISVERERDLMLSASARQIVEEIDRALERIKNKTYGLCTPAGRRISVERLEALPYAETCVDCKARAERRR